MTLRTSRLSLGWALAAFSLFVASMFLFELQLQHEQDRTDQANAYQIMLHDWEDRQTLYQQCQAQVEFRLEQIDQWVGFYDELDLIFKNNQLAVGTIDTVLRRELDQHLPKLDPKDCIPPGARPAPP
jgi:hypothetical protein